LWADESETRSRRQADVDDVDTVDCQLYYDDCYTLDDLEFIVVDPVLQDGVIRVVIALDKSGLFARRPM